MDDLDGPYRSPGTTRLGPVIQRFAVRRRRRAYGGAAAAAAPRPILLGGMVPPTAIRSGGGASARSVVVRDAIEVCAGGVRVREPFGVLELTWEDLAAVERVVLVGELHQVQVIGRHGEVITLDRSVYDLPVLADLLDQRIKQAAAARSP